VKHIGPEPPWRGMSRHYGEWRWVAPDPELWFNEQGYWELHEPPRNWTTYITGQVLRDIYVPVIQQALNDELIFLKGVEA